MIEYSEVIKKMNLFEKITQISSEIERLQKDDTVGFGPNTYKAISIEKVVEAVSEKMSKYGIMLYPYEQDYLRQDEEVKKKDGSVGINRISDVNVKYIVVNCHNPSETITVVSSGCGVDTQDKGVGKAMTYAYKNMLLKLFAIPTGDDTDKIQSDDYTKTLIEGSSSKKEKKVQTVSQELLDEMFAIADKKGYNKLAVKSMLIKKFNKEDEFELSPVEAKTMIAGFEKLTDKVV
ncbi:MAG: ERF family protein [Peptostreptococcaceae bacterium]